MDLFTKPAVATPHQRGLTVSQLTQKIKGLLEMEVSEAWVQGEISGFKPAASGHLYFSLKDEESLLSCALFRGVAQRFMNQQFQMKDGVEVLVHGKISVYPPRGSYQLIIDHIEPVGAGAFRIAFEKLKSQLEKEGLFKSERKKKLPNVPERIVVITSPTGAVIRDILNVLNRRSSGVSVLIIPTLVQGESAPAQIVEAIRTANKFKLGDVLILARGGGSLEDLWSFNNEAVVRALAESAIPTISAIGHETDVTLCDFVADLRAPTPSVAAELVTKHREELLEQLVVVEHRMGLQLRSMMQRIRNSVLSLQNRLISPQDRISKSAAELMQYKLRLSSFMQNLIPQHRQRIDDLQEEIAKNAQNLHRNRVKSFEVVAGKLEALSPLKVLGRGYTLVEDAQTGRLIKSVHSVHKGSELNLVFTDGKTKVKPA